MRSKFLIIWAVVDPVTLIFKFLFDAFPHISISVTCPTQYLFWFFVFSSQVFKVEERLEVIHVR